MNSAFRCPSQVDLEKAIATLEHLRAVKSPAPQMRFADIAVAAAYLKYAAQEEKALVRDGYFLLFDYAVPWYATQLVLIEDLTLRIEKTSTSAAAIPGWYEEIARQRGCVAAVGGDTQVGAMVTHFEAAGWVRLGVQLMKEI